MKFIPLTQGKVALVDDTDYEWLSQWKWCASKSGKTFYALRAFRMPNGTQTTLLLHRVILNVTDSDEVDHRNGNTLDNRRSNLRAATHAQNMRNRKEQKNSTSGIPGVSWYKQRNKWQSYIQVNDVRLHLGSFTDFEDAKAARLAAELKYHGQFSATLSRQTFVQNVPVIAEAA